MAIAYVQGDAEAVSPKSSWTYTLTLTAGNFVVLGVTYASGTITVTSVADGTNTWNSRDLLTASGNRSQLWYAENVAGGSTTITVTLSGTANAYGACDEYSGVATSSSFDVEASNSGTGTAVSSGNFTTAEDDSLIYAWASNTTIVDLNPGTGYTQRTASVFSGEDIGISEDDLTTTAGTNSATATASSSNLWLMVVGVFLAASTVTTLTADGGTFTITGTAANTEYHRVIAANSESFVVTGTAANTEHHQVIAADTGAYVVSGTAATTTYLQHVTMPADSGAFVVTGTAANTEHHQILTADAGSFAITGTDAGTLVSITVTADLGSFVVTGTAANTEYHRALVSSAGSFVITGTAATTTYNQGTTLAADAGAFSISGTAANTEYHQILVASGGTFAVTGTAAATLRGFTLTAAGGTVSVSGTAVTTLYSRVLTATAGAFLITGTDVSTSTADSPLAGPGLQIAKTWTLVNGRWEFRRPDGRYPAPVATLFRGGRGR